MKASLTLIPAALSLLLACSGSSTETSNAEIRALNMALATKAQSLGLTYLDTYSILVAQSGKPMVFFYQPDGEHLSELGYLRWVDARLRPYLSVNKATCVGMVGDSITRRVNAVQLQNPTRDATWDDLLGIKAYNMGVDGETSADVIRRLDSIVHDDIDCYFLMIGNNDLHAGIRIGDIVANVETIVTYIQAHSGGKPVVIQAVMPLNLS